MNASRKTHFSEIPSLLPPDKNITVTLFITLSYFDESQLDVGCDFKEGCPIGLEDCDESNFFYHILKIC
ncbi:hypothetical protein Avbf_10925 [Armadillidium vulgare]|nr:hypothetical protein Avbf_10925 [Armadillidium vulgare]